MVLDGAWFKMPVDLESPVPLFVRGGFAIPTQTPANNTQFRFYAFSFYHSLAPKAVIMQLNGANMHEMQPAGAEALKKWDGGRTPQRRGLGRTLAHTPAMGSGGVTLRKNVCKYRCTSIFKSGTEFTVSAV